MLYRELRVESCWSARPPALVALFTGAVFCSVAIETTWETKAPVRCACKRTGAKYFSQNVSRRCCCSAFGYPRLDHFSEETSCPFRKRQFVRKAGFQYQTDSMIPDRFGCCD